MPSRRLQQNRIRRPCIDEDHFARRNPASVSIAAATRLFVGRNGRFAKVSTQAVSFGNLLIFFGSRRAVLKAILLEIEYV